MSFFDGQLKYLADHNYDIWVVSSTAIDKDFAERNSISYRTVDIQRRFAPIADIKSIISLVHLIRREKFDVVIGHTPKGAMVAMIAAKFARVKERVYYRHGLIYTTAKGLKRFILKTVERFTAAWAKTIINVSPSLNKLALTDKLNSDKKQRIIGKGTCGGIDTIDTFNPENLPQDKVKTLRSSLALPNDVFVIGFCGRLCPDKGIKELIEGFNLFTDTHPEIDARLLLVGPYDTRDILPPDTKYEIETNQYIIATGNIPHQDLPSYYSLMDVFVFPSHREGFGMTVLEASAMRLPILVSRSHGCVDSILENVTGQYIQLNGPNISSSLGRMLDADLRKRLGNAGRDFVKTNFERTVLWPRILDFYKEILTK